MLARAKAVAQRLVVTAATTASLAGFAHAQSDTADVQALSAAYFGASTQTGRSDAFAEITRLAEDDNAARFVLGSAQFFAAIENLAQGLHRHGMRSGGTMVMLFRLPLPPNPDPEPLDYEAFRQLLETFHADLDLARATLSTVEPDVGFKIVSDMQQTRLNLTGAEVIPPEANLKAVALALRMLRGNAGEAQLVFAYDNADAIWLEGYANLLMAHLDFVLAHDFRRAFETTMHAAFPDADLPLAGYLVPEQEGGQDPWSDGRIFDLVALLHLIDFEVIAPERRAAVRTRLLDVIELSRANWAAIGAETDADREWLPGPQQGGSHPVEGVVVTAEAAEAWLEALDLFEAVLQGELLVPHFRLSTSRAAADIARNEGVGFGLDMRAFFERGDRFDLVLLLTGSALIPYARNGDVIDMEEWQQTRRALGRRGLFGSAVWFN
ncbi:hypothetical protein [Roseitalea porphyridii]|uniref:Uncharacterized protein n=1 Tax=Roseitalea porphyridii TaxID=1852022 RepID=A0A4P6UZB7_9HYPH|nr:hypothetical protein [Roseitalea porphyridii]QBK29679.1 hypothetical protein E0E05_03125 [Roseitalea porphyridii]